MGDHEETIPEWDLRELTHRALREYEDAGERVLSERRRVEELLGRYSRPLAYLDEEHKLGDGALVTDVIAVEGARVAYIAAATKFSVLGSIYSGIFPKSNFSLKLRSILKTLPKELERKIFGITRDLADHRIDIHNRDLGKDRN